MRDILQKKSTQVVMIVLVLVIWVYNMAQIITIQSDTENVREMMDFTLVDSTDLNTMSTYTFTYSGDFRDPFLSGIRDSPSTPQNSPEPFLEESQPTSRPSIRLYGIVEGLAVIKKDGQGIHFMNTGEKLEGIRIQKIYTDSVTFVYNNEEFTLNLH